MGKKFSYRTMTMKMLLILRMLIGKKRRKTIR